MEIKTGIEELIESKEKINDTAECGITGTARNNINFRFRRQTRPAEYVAPNGSVVVIIIIVTVDPNNGERRLPASSNTMTKRNNLNFQV